MNGKEQVTAMAKLMNSDQAAPAADAWRPDNLAGFRVGDLADVASLGRVEIVGLLPPSLLEVRTATGARCKCGWRAAQKVNRK